MKLLNIWKVTAIQLEKIWITQIEDFISKNPYEIFHELKTKVDPTLCKSCLAWIVWAKLNIKRNEAIKFSTKEYKKIYWEKLE